jgi:hypothetical protein
MSAVQGTQVHTMYISVSQTAGGNPISGHETSIESLKYNSHVFILYPSLFLTVGLQDKGIGPIWLMALEG